MNQPATSPECHSPIPFDAPDGLCPRCLLTVALNTKLLADAVGNTTGESAAPVDGSVPGSSIQKETQHACTHNVTSR